jgi:hypothetical protein
MTRYEMCRACEGWWIFPWVCGPGCKTRITMFGEGEMRRKCRGCGSLFKPRFDRHVWCSRACKTRTMKARKDEAGNAQEAD